MACLSMASRTSLLLEQELAYTVGSQQEAVDSPMVWLPKVAVSLDKLQLLVALQSSQEALSSVNLLNNRIQGSSNSERHLNSVEWAEDLSLERPQLPL